MKRKYGKQHNEWRDKIRLKFDNKCIVCGESHLVAAHHLIPWEVEGFRHDPNNGILLCPKHHTKYSYGLSPHSDGAALFYIWLRRHHPKIMEWIEVNYYEI